MERINCSETCQLPPHALYAWSKHRCCKYWIWIGVLYYFLSLRIIPHLFIFILRVLLYQYVNSILDLPKRRNCKVKKKWNQSIYKNRYTKNESGLHPLCRKQKKDENKINKKTPERKQKNKITIITF